MNTGRLKIAAALVLTGPFIPMLFQGEEWGASSPFLYFTDHRDPELGRAVTEGRRREFAAFSAHVEDVPDPQAPETMERSKLNWAEREKDPHAELLDWHRRLIRLRRELTALTDPRLEQVHVSFDEQAKWLVMKRGSVAVACNIAPAGQRIPLAIGASDIVLASDNKIRLVDESLELPADSAAVLVSARTAAFAIKR
jgi:maltooligosyltrehalose trehalohydrolase